MVDDWLLELLLLLAVLVPVGALLGHLWVAYVYAPRRAVEGVKAFFKDDAEAAGLITDRLGPALSEYLDSEEGKQHMARFLEVGGNFIVGKVTSWLEGAAGGAARTAQNKAEKLALATMAIKTGNPVADGLIAMLPVDVKRRIIRQLLGAVRGATAEEIGEVTSGPDEWNP